MPLASLEDEFDRQLATLAENGYADLAGLSWPAFARQVEPLRDLLPMVAVSDPDVIPFAIVVTSSLVPTVGAVERFVVRGLPGWTDMHDEIDRYRPIDGVAVPLSPVYLLADVDTGKSTLGVSPNEALPMILAAGRTPLTVDEGVALVTHVPGVLTERNAFQALASRAANKRVPTFWLSKGAPRLGWCWAGNPHSWLGAASAVGRHGVG